MTEQEELIVEALHEAKDFSKMIRSYLHGMSGERSLNEKELKLFEMTHDIHVHTNDAILMMQNIQDEKDEKQAEKEFHNQRKAFAIFDDKLNWCPKGLSHHEWLIDGGLFDEAQFNDLVRGYVDNTGIYFYSGDFETSEYVEDMAKSWHNSIDPTKPIYCGVHKGKIGERWEPIKQLDIEQQVKELYIVEDDDYRFVVAATGYAEAITVVENKTGRENNWLQASLAYNDELWE